MRHLTRGFNGATIDWSHDLLTTGEQGIFARLAIFAPAARSAIAITVKQTVMMRASLLAPFS